MLPFVNNYDQLISVVQHYALVGWSNLINEWHALLTLCLPSPLFTLLRKKVLKMDTLQINTLVDDLVAGFKTTVKVVETFAASGTAADKKAAAEKMIAGPLDTKLKAVGVPGFVADLLTSDVVLGTGIDWAVAEFNKLGLFSNPATGGGTQPTG